MFTNKLCRIKKSAKNHIMNESICNYIHILKEVFTQRQKANAYYSLRAYARDLKVHPSTLSLILKEKRKLPLKNLKTVTAALNLSPSKENLFKESFYRTKARLDDIKINEEFKDRYLLDEAYHDIIAEWEHYAILSLIETKDFKSQPEFIAKKFGINKERAEIVIENLIRANLLINENGKYRLTQNPLRTTEDISSKALRKSHIETLDMGKNKLEEVELEFRDFSSMTIAVNHEKLAEAKTIIREFRQKLASLLRDGEKTEVYQVAIQLYPLTKNYKETLQ